MYAWDDFKIRRVSSEEERHQVPKKKEVQIPSSVNCNGIEALSAILKRVSESKGDLASQLEWLNNEFPFDAAVYGSTPGSITDRNARANRARDALREVELARDVVSHWQLQAYLDAQCTLVKEKAEAFILRSGFESLPDNILSDVLELATRPQPVESTTNAVDVDAELQSLREARTLSHVCQRFRYLILDKARVWNIISERMRDIENVKFCTRFSKQAPMVVSLEQWGLRQYEEKFERFFETCLLSSDRWGSLTFGSNDSKLRDSINAPARWEEISRNLASISRLSGALELPALQCLVVLLGRVSPPEYSNANICPFWHWSMPNLVGLELSGACPPPANLPCTQSLKEFTFTFGNIYTRGQRFETGQLVEFLSNCKALEYVSLSFNNVGTATSCPLQSIASVDQVEFSFCRCRPAAGIALCSSLHFPNASEVTLSVEDLVIPANGADGPSSIELLVRECLSRLPRTKTLEFSFRQNRVDLTPIIPPIDLLPALEDLTFKFRRWRDLQFWGDESSIPRHIRLPPIRRLTLVTTCISTCWYSVKPWAEKFFAQLEKQDDLGSFRKFRISQTGQKTRPSPLIEGSIFNYISGEKFILSWAE